MIYFKTYAKEHGCENVDELGDLAIWNWIREYQIITVWESVQAGAWPANGCGPQAADVLKHNHISNGYDANATEPTPSCELQQKAWKGGKWRGSEAHITCYNVVKRGKVAWTNKIPQS